MFTADTGEVLADDADDPMRTALHQIVGVITQLDRALVAKRLRDGRQAKTATGRKAVGAYRGNGKGRERDAAPDASEQTTVARILELRPAGLSYRAIAAMLDVEGLAPRRASAWSAMAVRNVAIRRLESLDVV